MIDYDGLVNGSGDIKHLLTKLSVVKIELAVGVGGKEEVKRDSFGLTTVTRDV